MRTLPNNPWDPSDDISPNSMYLYATNRESSILNPENTIYWKWHTYDKLGISWGYYLFSRQYLEMTPGFSTTQGSLDPWSGITQL